MLNPDKNVCVSLLLIAVDLLRSSKLSGISPYLSLALSRYDLMRVPLYLSLSVENPDMTLSSAFIRKPDLPVIIIYVEVPV